MTMLLQFTVRQVAETEARFTSVERISHYIRSVPREADWEKPEKKPASNWPYNGAIRLSGIKVTNLAKSRHVVRKFTSHPYLV